MACSEGCLSHPWAGGAQKPLRSYGLTPVLGPDLGTEPSPLPKPAQHPRSTLLERHAVSHLKIPWWGDLGKGGNPATPTPAQVLWSLVGTGVHWAPTIPGHQTPAPSSMATTLLGREEMDSERHSARPGVYGSLPVLCIVCLYTGVSTEGERGTHKNPRYSSTRTPTVLSVRVLPATARGNGALAAPPCANRWQGPWPSPLPGTSRRRWGPWLRGTQSP